jgi:hypothetical protein
MKMILVFGLLLGSAFVHAQKKVSHVDQTWLGLVQLVRVSPHWGFMADESYRTSHEWLQGNNLAQGRVGITYYISNRTQVSAGYAYAHSFAGENHPQNARAEHRPWQQVLWTNNASRLRLLQRVRLEERWRQHLGNRGEVAPGYNFNYRAGMFLQLLYPLGKQAYTPGSVALLLSDELMINMGKEIVMNTFDQNRVIAGIQWQVTKAGYLQAGWMHAYQQLSSGQAYRRSEIARIFYTHNINLQRRKA